MFAVYPESPRQKSTSPWLYILGGCGGCALIAVIVVVGLGVWGYGKAKDVVAGLQEQPKTVEKFLGNLKAHQYPSAVTLMSPEGQQALPEAELQKRVEEAEQKLGPLQSWSKVDFGTKNSQMTTPQSSGKNGMDNEYHPMLTFAKGKMEASITFHSKDPLNPSLLISSFELTLPPTAGSSNQ